MNETWNFDLPAFGEIPNVGLFLEQTTRYINTYLQDLGFAPLTNSMLSNYVKKKLVKNPVRKMYDREQIAVVIFIAVAKQVLALEDVQLLLGMQQEHYTTQEAYDYFRTALQQELQYVFGEEAAGDGQEGAMTAEAQTGKKLSKAGNAENDRPLVTEENHDTEEGDRAGAGEAEERTLLRNVTRAIAYQVYLEKYLQKIRG